MVLGKFFKSSSTNKKDNVSPDAKAKAKASSSPTPISDASPKTSASPRRSSSFATREHDASNVHHEKKHEKPHETHGAHHADHEKHGTHDKHGTHHGHHEEHGKHHDEHGTHHSHHEDHGKHHGKVGTHHSHHEEHGKHHGKHGTHHSHHVEHTKHHDEVVEDHHADEAPASPRPGKKPPHENRGKATMEERQKDLDSHFVHDGHGYYERHALPHHADERHGYAVPHGKQHGQKSAAASQELSKAPLEGEPKSEVEPASKTHVHHLRLSAVVAPKTLAPNYEYHDSDSECEFIEGGTTEAANKAVEDRLRKLRQGEVPQTPINLTYQEAAKWRDELRHRGHMQAQKRAYSQGPFEDMLVWGMEELQQYWFDKEPPKLDEASPKSKAASKRTSSPKFKGKPLPKVHATKTEEQEKRDKEEHHAATGIQVAFRTRKKREERKKQEEQTQAATKIQAIIRGKQAREETRRKQEEIEIEQEQKLREFQKPYSRWSPRKTVFASNTSPKNAHKQVEKRKTRIVTDWKSRLQQDELQPWSESSSPIASSNNRNQSSLPVKSPNKSGRKDSTSPPPGAAQEKQVKRNSQSPKQRKADTSDQLQPAPQRRNSYKDLLGDVKEEMKLLDNSQQNSRSDTPGLDKKQRMTSLYGQSRASPLSLKGCLTSDRRASLAKEIQDVTLLADEIGMPVAEVQLARDRSKSPLRISSVVQAKSQAKSESSKRRQQSYKDRRASAVADPERQTLLAEKRNDRKLRNNSIVDDMFFGGLRSDSPPRRLVKSVSSTALPKSSQHRAKSVRPCAAGQKELNAFKDLLLKHADNFAHVWRLMLDTETTGKCTISDFGQAVRKMQDCPNIRRLWKALDCSNRGTMTFLELDVDSGVQLLLFHQALRGACGEDAESAFKYLDVGSRLRIPKEDFCTTVTDTKLIPPDAAQKVFDMLCMNNRSGSKKGAEPGYDRMQGAVLLGDIKWMRIICNAIEDRLEAGDVPDNVSRALQAQSWQMLLACGEFDADSPAATSGQQQARNQLVNQVRGRVDTSANKLFHDAAWRDKVHQCREDEYYNMFGGPKGKGGRGPSKFLFERLYRDGELKHQRREWLEKTALPEKEPPRPLDPESEGRILAPRVVPEPEPIPKTGVEREVDEEWYKQAHEEGKKRDRRRRGPKLEEAWARIVDELLVKEEEIAKSMWIAPDFHERLYKDAAAKKAHLEEIVESQLAHEHAELNAMRQSSRFFGKPHQRVNMIRIEKLYNDYKKVAQNREGRAKAREEEERRMMELLSVKHKTLGKKIPKHQRGSKFQWDEESSSDDGMPGHVPKKSLWVKSGQHRKCSVPDVVEMLSQEPQVYAMPPFLDMSNIRWDMPVVQPEPHNEPKELKVFNDLQTHSQPQPTMPHQQGRRDHLGYHHSAGSMHAAAGPIEPVEASVVLARTLLL